VNPFGSAGKDDDTPFDGSGLNIKTIKTRRQLNETDLRDTESPIRGEYIAAMKQADLRNYGPLIDLHKKFSE
jgi:hypothetical protein